MKWIDTIREDITVRGSSFRTEVLAGIATFLSLAYIFVVNPAILGQAGIDPKAVLFATAIASGVATLAMGLRARLPFVLAPGLEMNAYVAFVVVGTMGFTWQQGLGAVLWSGILFLVLTHFEVREAIIHSIPDKMKFALALAVGAFVLTIGLSLSGVIVYENQLISGIGSLTTPKAFAFFGGLTLILILERLKIPGAVLITIAASVAYLLSVNPGVSSATQATDGSMFDAFLQVDMTPHSLSFISAVLILFLVDFYGSIAKFIGMTMNTEIRTLDDSGRSVVPRTHEALMIDGAGTCFGATLGTTSVTTYVESAVGIAAGGRTGLTAIVCSILMFATLLLAQYIPYVPVEATTGALAYVGYRLIPRKEIRSSYDKWDWAVAIGMPLLVIGTFSLDWALMLGFAVYGILQFQATRKTPWFLVLSALALAVGKLLQIFGS